MEISLESTSGNVCRDYVELFDGETQVCFVSPLHAAVFTACKHLPLT